MARIQRRTSAKSAAISYRSARRSPSANMMATSEPALAPATPRTPSRHSSKGIPVARST